MLTNQQRALVMFWSLCLLVLSLVAPAFFHADLLTASQLDGNGHFPREVVSTPMHFNTDPFGRITAYTAGGVLLHQAEIIEAGDAYLHRLDIDGTFFYVSDRGTFSANTDTVAISIYHGLSV